MERLKQGLEELDEAIFALEDVSRETSKKQIDLLKKSRLRETEALAATQKVAARLDQAIEHLENALRD